MGTRLYPSGSEPRTRPDDNRRDRERHHPPRTHAGIGQRRREAGGRHSRMRDKSAENIGLIASPTRPPNGSKGRALLRQRRPWTCATALPAEGSRARRHVPQAETVIRRRWRTGGFFGIRTHGGLSPHGGFQDRCLKPLGTRPGGGSSRAARVTRGSDERQT